MKTTPGDINILHMCTKNYDQTMYGSWDMTHDGCNYFSFWAIFCPFTPVTAQKIKILKEWKKCLEISSFYIWVLKIMIRWCTVPEIWCVMDRRTDGWMDGRTEGKSDIEVGAPSKIENSQIKKLGQSTEYNVRTFLRKLCRKWGREASPRPLFVF